MKRLRQFVGEALHPGLPVRSHRHAAEATLRDYAAFASWELGRRLEDGLVSPLNVAMMQARITTEITLATASAPAPVAASLERFRSGLMQQAIRSDTYQEFLRRSANACRSSPDLPQWLAAGVRLPDHGACARVEGSQPLTQEVARRGPGSWSAVTDPDPIRLCVEPLEAIDVSYIITGGVASVIYGDPRLPRDVDIVMELRQAEISARG